MCIKVLQGYGKIDALELRFFLAGPQGEIKVEKNPTDWLDDLEWAEAYKNIFAMSQLDAFKGFTKFFIANEKEFQKLFDSPEPENFPLPGVWNDKLNSFQKLIVLKSIRLDKIIMGI